MNDDKFRAAMVQTFLDDVRPRLEDLDRALALVRHEIREHGTANALRAIISPLSHLSAYLTKWAELGFTMKDAEAAGLAVRPVHRRALAWAQALSQGDIQAANYIADEAPDNLADLIIDTENSL